MAFGRRKYAELHVNKHDIVDYENLCELNAPETNTEGL